MIDQKLNAQHDRLPAWLPRFTLALVAAGCLRYAYSAVYIASTNHAWFVIRRQLWPLLEFVWRGRPVADTMQGYGPWQARYGPVTFLVAHPLAALTGPATMEFALLLLGHLCFFLTLFLIDRRFFASSPWPVRALLVGVALNFTPILITLSEKAWNVLELLLMTMGLYLLTSSSPGLQRLAGAPLVAGILTRLMPVLTFVFLAVRDRTSALVGVLAGAGILTVSHLLYGSEMGWGYLPRAVAIVQYGTSATPFGWDNNSPRGLLYKWINGFHYTESRPGQMFVDPGKAAAADAILGIATLAVMSFVVMKLWRWPRGGQGELEQLRLLGAFALGAVLILLLAPYAPMPYMVPTLLGFVLLLRAWQCGVLFRSEIVMGIGALVLIGNLVPNTVMVWVTGSPWIYRALGNAPRLLPNETFLFFGWAGYGLILLSIILMRVQRRLVRSGASLDPPCQGVDQTA